MTILSQRNRAIPVHTHQKVGQCHRRWDSLSGTMTANVLIWLSDVTLYITEEGEILRSKDQTKICMRLLSRSIHSHAQDINSCLDPRCTTSDLSHVGKYCFTILRGTCPIETMCIGLMMWRGSLQCVLLFVSIPTNQEHTPMHWPVQFPSPCPYDTSAL